MATLLEKNELASNPDFIARVKMAMVNTAACLPNEKYPTADHVELGVNILAYPDSYAEGFAMAVATLPYIDTDSSDETIQYGVNCVFDAAAGSYEYVDSGGAVMPYPVAAARGKNFINAASFSPLDIAGLVAWWDFSDSNSLFTDAGTTPVSSNGDKIYQVNDKSTSGYNLIQATEAKRPLWQTNQQNGLATAKGDGSQQFLAKTSGFWSVGTSNYSIFMIGKAGSSTRQGWQIKNSGGGNPSIYQYFNISGAERINHKDDAGNEVAGGAWNIAASTTAYYLSSLIRNGTAFNRYINGGSANNQTVAIGATTTNVFYMFCANGASAFHDGYIAEMLIYSAALSAGDFAILKTYLNTKWAIY